MNFWKFLSLITTVYSQATSGGIGMPPFGTSSTILMNSMNFPPQGNYSIGYLPPEIIGTNVSACNRVSMFKFPALYSGIATSMVLNVLPISMSMTCDIGFTLYDMAGTTIGNTFIGSFTNGPSQNPEQSMIANITTANWLLANGTAYYVTIQTFTWNTAGTQCFMRFPWGMDTTTPPKYALIVSQGPDNQPCGATPWIVKKALDGGYIHMSLLGNSISTQTSTKTPTPTLTPTPTSTKSNKNIVMSSIIYTQTQTQTQTPTSSSTSMPSVTSTNSYSIVINPSDSNTQTPTSSSTSSPSVTSTNSYINIIDLSFTSTPSIAPLVSNTPTPTYTPTPSPLSTVNTNTTMYMSVSVSTTYTPNNSFTNQINNYDAYIPTSLPSTNVSAIIGGSIGAFVIIGIFLSIIIINYKKQIGSSRSPVSSIIIMNPIKPTDISMYMNSTRSDWASV